MVFHQTVQGYIGCIVNGRSTALGVNLERPKKEIPQEWKEIIKEEYEKFRQNARDWKCLSNIKSTLLFKKSVWELFKYIFGINMETKFLELLNATLGLSLLLLSLILVRDLRKQIASKDKRVKMALILIGAGIIIFSVRELIKYGISDGMDDVFDELLETIYLFLTLGAFFSLLTLKELPARDINEK